MKKVDLTKAQMVLTKHSPEILTGIGIAGMVSTVVMAVKATPKALEIIDDAEKDKCDVLTKTEVVKATWKCYIPAAVTGVISTACIVGASSVNLKRNAALTAAYTLSETALSEYKDQVIKTIGEKKEQEIKDKIAKDRVEKNPAKNTEVFITEKGNTLCFDTISGRYFKSDIDQIKRAVNFLNKRLIEEMYVSLNDFYYEIGLKQTTIGDELGWNIDQDLIDISFSSQLAEDGVPCLVLDYMVAPRYRFGDM